MRSVNWFMVKISFEDIKDIILHLTLINDEIEYL